MSSDFSANASALGYFYQARYALFLLLVKADVGIEMAVEKLDDISFEQNGSPIELLQTKHHINSTASLTDASTDLWKTLRVWSVAVADGTVDLGSTALILITTGLAPNDSAASRLRPQSASGRDTDEALRILLEVAGSSTSKTNEAGYASFRSLSPSQQLALVNSISVLDASPNIVDAREQILKQMRIVTRPQFLEAVFERVEGWWFNRLIAHLSESSATPILYRELLDQINDIQEQYHADNLPIEFLDSAVPDESELNEDEKIFIEQLRLIALGEPRIKKAINDYYRAFQQRSKWVRDELLLVGELEGYENRLIDEWERLYEAAKEDLEDDVEEGIRQREGKALFNVIQKMEIHIRSRCNEPYVMRGSYHMLANQLRVGWHANFLDRLEHVLAKQTIYRHETLGRKTN